MDKILDNEIVNSLKDTLNKRINSSVYGTFSLYWLVFHWNFIFTIFFVSEDKIWESTHLLKNDYLLKVFFNYYDLIFVDADKRQECINASFGRTSVIVVHDLDRKNINRGFLKGIINNNYILFMANIAHPATSIFTNDRYLIEKLNNSNTFTKIDQTEFVEVFFGKK